MSARKVLVAVFVAGIISSVALAAPPSARAPLKEVMVKIVEPTSNAVFYIGRQAPKNDDEWKALQGQALMLNEVANSLLTPARAMDNKQWMQDAKLLLEASSAAYTAANRKNATALEDLNDQLYTACATCHEHYLPKR